MSLSINEINMSNLLILSPDEGYLKRTPYQYFEKLNEKEAFNNKIIKIVNNNFKILFALHPRMYHLFLDNLSLIILINEYYKKQKINFNFILEISDIPPFWFDEDGPTYFKFFIKVLKDLNINHIFIRTRSLTDYEMIENNERKFNVDSIIKINNYALWSCEKVQEQQLVILSKIFKKYLPKNKKIIPNKTVYLSRISTKDSWVSNFRTDNEESLVNFFKGLGCEIVVAEDFKTFEEQIEYFSSVKTLIGLTGTGFMNMLMMEDGGNVIELYTPICQDQPNLKNSEVLVEDLSLHNFYRDFSWVKNHAHLSLKNNYKGNSLDLINNLKNNELLFLFFSKEKK